MKMRIAILAACASTLALAQINLAPAGYVGAAESTSLVTTTDIGLEPATMLAQSNIKDPSTIKGKTGAPAGINSKGDRWGSSGEAGAPNKSATGKGCKNRVTGKGGKNQLSISDQAAAGTLCSY